MGKARKAKTRATAIAASHVVDMLAARHTKDVFVPECKDGPTHYANHRRMDAWAMSRSWVSPVITAYEVKVARSDFLADDKWLGYLRLCNCFYFVCGHGVCQASEVPSEAGLLVVSQTGSRLFCKRKAPYRDVAIPEALFRYVLMCRTTVRRAWQQQPESSQEYWQEWIANRRYDQQFGYQVGKGIRQVVDARITEVEAENRALTRKHAEYEDVRAFMKDHGVDKNAHFVADCLQRQWRRLAEAIPYELRARLLRVADGLNKANVEIAAIETRAKPQGVGDDATTHEMAGAEG